MVQLLKSPILERPLNLKLLSKGILYSVVKDMEKGNHLLLSKMKITLPQIIME